MRIQTHDLIMGEGSGDEPLSPGYPESSSFWFSFLVTG